MNWDVHGPRIGHTFVVAGASLLISAVATALGALGILSWVFWPFAGVMFAVGAGAAGVGAIGLYPYGLDRAPWLSIAGALAAIAVITAGVITVLWLPAAFVLIELAWIVVPAWPPAGLWLGFYAAAAIALVAVGTASLTAPEPPSTAAIFVTGAGVVFAILAVRIHTDALVPSAPDWTAGMLIMLIGLMLHGAGTVIRNQAPRDLPG